MLFRFIHIYIYIYAFSRRFYPKRLSLHSSYSFYILSALYELIKFYTLSDSPVFLLSLTVGDSVGHLPCCIQQFTFSLCSCVQFLTLVLISVERFLAIAFPFKKRTEKIGIWILFIWVCVLFIAVLSLVMRDNSCYVMCQYLQKSPGSRTDPFGVCCFPSEVCL